MHHHFAGFESELVGSFDEPVEIGLREIVENRHLAKCGE
jgi:hypothetical protein